MFTMEKYIVHNICQCSKRKTRIVGGNWVGKSN